MCLRPNRVVCCWIWQWIYMWSYLWEHSHIFFDTWPREASIHSYPQVFTLVGKDTCEWFDVIYIIFLISLLVIYSTTPSIWPRHSMALRHPISLLFQLFSIFFLFFFLFFFSFSFLSGNFFNIFFKGCNLLITFFFLLFCLFLCFKYWLQII